MARWQPHNALRDVCLCVCAFKCNLVANADSVRSGRIKRFQMKTSSMELDRETPPWILVEFGEPMEAEKLQNTLAIGCNGNCQSQLEVADLKRFVSAQCCTHLISQAQAGAGLGQHQECRHHPLCYQNQPVHSAQL